MPIFGIAVMALLAVGAGSIIGGAVGAGISWLLVLRQIRLRECQGAQALRPEEEFSSGCGALLAGALLGSLLGTGVVLGLGYLVVTL